MRKIWKRTLALLLAAILLCGAAPTAFAEGGEIVSGTCGATGDGSNLTWELNTGTGKLTIRGTGEMKNYSTIPLVPSPWDSYRESIGVVVIEDGVKSIGSYAFEQCTSLVSIAIPDSVTSIGGYAFEECTSLAGIAIPDSLTYIGSGTFFHCISLTALTVDQNNTAYSSDIDGVLYNKDQTILIQYPIGNPRTSFSIPDNVTEIGNEAFEYCTSIESVTIPDGVTKIGRAAFHNCTSLSNVTIPSSVTEIGAYAFLFCTSLAGIKIPDSVTEIGSATFGFCSSLASVTVPDNLTKIGSDAFRYCTSLASVTIPDSLTEIGNYAFSHCESLESITIPDGVTAISQYTFSDCTHLASVTIPDSVTEIGSYAFSFCESLESITIPYGITTINERTFSRCTSLSSITIPDSMTEIGDSAFEYCGSLSSIMIPNSVTGIGSSAFSNCKSLLSVEIPDKMTVINRSTFSGCTSLSSVTIPNSVTEISDSAFSNCVSLENVAIPDSVTHIGKDAFNKSGLKHLILSKNTANIGLRAFFNTVLQKVCYDGTPESRTHIEIGSNNEKLLNATWYYHNHDAQNAERIGEKAATCTENGYTGDLGFECGIVLEQGEMIPARGHDWKSVNAVAADCTTAGHSTYTQCTRCSEYKPGAERVDYSALGHAWKTTNAVAADCTTAGHSAYTQCTRCSEYKAGAEREDYSALGHDWIAASCTEAKTCSRCKITEGDALGHDYDVVVTAPTCEAKGYTTFTCSRCSDSYTDNEAAALGHNYVITAKANATCTDTGFITYTCSRDNTHSYTETIPAKGHTFGAWQQTKAPTEYEYGEKKRECSVCHAVEKEQIEKLSRTELTLNKTSVTLQYKTTDTLTASETVTWSSSNEKVVKVDANGRLTTVKRGTAVVTAHSVQGDKTAACTVTVKYAWWQWLIIIFLLGFIWY